MKKFTKNSLYKLALVIVLIVAQSCTKTMTEELMYVAADAPKTITAGQLITAKVRLQYATTSFKVDFEGFQTKEVSTHHYSIVAIANITSHGETSANTAAWLKDTTYTVHTVEPGQYILDFVYSDNIFKSDTVVAQ